MRLWDTVFASVLFNALPCFPQQHILSPLDAFVENQHATSSAPPYRDRLLSLHKQLVDIESITGNEEAVGKFLGSYLQARGYNARLLRVPTNGTDANNTAQNRWDVVAWSPGDREFRPRLALTSHIDVVPPYIGYSISDDPPTSSSVIRGRGSVDAKASVAAQVTAVEELLAEGAVGAGDVLLLYVVGEEVSGDGMRKFSDDWARFWPQLEFDAVIFGEPTRNRLACGHKGHVTCTLSARGKAGHSGYPWLGKSATEVLVRALVRILDADLGSSEEYGNTTVNVGVMEGGVAANVISERASARLAVRVATGPQKDGHEIVRKRMEKIVADVDGDALHLDCGNGYGVVPCDCDVDGFETIVVNYGTDVPNLEGSHTRYLYGPGDILVAHSDHEALTVRDLETAVDGYKKLIKHVLQPKKG